MLRRTRQALRHRYRPDLAYRDGRPRGCGRGPQRRARRHRVYRRPGAARSSRQFGHIRPGGRRCSRRSLPHAAPARDRAVLGRRGRPRAVHPARRGARAAVIVAHSVAELPAGERTVAIGSFDGVHRGHRRVLDAARDAGGAVTVVTFWPHPRLVLGNRVELLSTLERRLELLEAARIDETLVVSFTPSVAALEPEEFADSFLRLIGAKVIVVGEDFRFGRAAAGDAATLERLGFEVHAVPLLAGVSSTQIRASLREGDVAAAAQLLGRPAELDGTVVLGDQRGGTLGFPTANLAVAADLLLA